MKREITKTADGSTTIYIPEMDENYHSHHGAIQEAKHVFVQYGVGSVSEEELTIFEMGFGTGLNALLTLDYALANNKKINYLGIEAFPVDVEMIDDLNYVESIDLDLWAAFDQMHNCPWNEKFDLFENFQLTKIHQKIEDYEPVPESIDIIYFDAFGPRAQGDMWELPVLEKMAQMIKPGGILVTYCAQGQFKRHLKSLGFTIERLPGPPGKREMTRATKVAV